ncbi:MAG: hypothetical protein BME94_02570 [Methanobacteriales archaeon Met13]
MNLNSSSTGEDIAELALAIHELLNRLPLTMRTKNQLGVRVEDGKVIDYNYTGPTLELVLQEGKISHKVPETGPYQGTQVVVVPIREEGEVIAAVGVVDTTQGIYSDIIQITKRPEEINEGD